MPVLFKLKAMNRQEIIVAKYKMLFEMLDLDWYGYLALKKIEKTELEKAEIYNVQPKNDMQCGVGKNNI